MDPVYSVCHMLYVFPEWFFRSKVKREYRWIGLEPEMLVESSSRFKISTRFPHQGHNYLFRLHIWLKQHFFKHVNHSFIWMEGGEGCIHLQLQCKCLCLIYRQEVLLCSVLTPWLTFLLISQHHSELLSFIFHIFRTLQSKSQLLQIYFSCRKYTLILMKCDSM